MNFIGNKIHTAMGSMSVQVQLATLEMTKCNYTCIHHINVQMGPLRIVSIWFLM